MVTAPAASADESEPVSCSVERTASDTASAALNARLSGCRIEDLSQRTETSSTFARPDGDWDITYAMSPVWVRTGGDGTAVEDWAALDTDLRTADDDGFAPAAHPAGVWISGAQAAGRDGVSVVASLTDPSTDVTSEVTWPGDLPEPEVTGPRVRYLGVEPGVDMVVDMTGGGIEQYFVLHDVPADASQVELPVGVQSQGATVVDTSDDTEAAGLADLVTADGDETVARVGVPLVWDATYDGQLAHPVLADYDPADEAPLWAGALGDLEAADVEPEAEEPGLLDQVGAAVADAVNGEPEPLDLGEVAEATTQVEVATGGESADITLGLSDDFAEAATAGAVVVDPSVSLALPWDTYVQTDSSVDQSMETELRLGTFDGGTTRARTFMNVNASQIIGKSIRSATLSLWEHHSYSCTPSEWQVWNASRVPGPITWATQPTIGSQHGSSTQTKGHSAPCADGWVTMDMTSLARAWASDTATERGMLLRAASETDSYGWKRFNSTNAATGKPTITVTVNTAPATPGSTSLASGSYNWYPSSTATNRELYVKTTQPVFSTVASDPDGDRVRSSITVVEGATTVLADGVGGYVASGGTSKYTTAAGLLVNGHTYSSNVRAFDGLLASARKNLWTFTVDTANPATPSVTASGYTDGQWRDTRPSSNTFTFTDTSTDVVKFEYSLDGGAWTSVTASGTSPKTATLAWNPANGAHTLRVHAVDRAARSSADRSFTFGAGGAAISAPKSGLKSTDVFTVKATAPTASSGTVTPRIFWRAAGTAEPADYNASNGSTTGWTEGAALTAVGAGTAVSVNRQWSAAAAAEALGKARVPVLLDVQVCFQYSSPAVTRCTWNQDQTLRSTVVRVPHAFGDDYPTAEAGPGQVALWTGEFNTSATDVSVPGYVGDLSVTRSYSSQAGPGDDSVFGPGWQAGFDGTDTGIAGFEVVDSTDIDGTFALVDDEGGALVYRQPGNTKSLMKTGTYTAVDDDTAEAGARLTLTGSGTAARLTFTEEDGTVTQFAYTGTADSYGDRVWAPVSVTEPGSAGSTTFTRDSSNRVTRILAPVPPGVTCPASGALNPGCRAVSVAYGTTTSGTDVAGQVREISYTAYDPDRSGGAGMTTVVVARYEYNSARQLTKVTDPRSGLSTTYAYSGTSTSGQPLLTEIVPPGLAGDTLTYGAGSQDSMSLLAVSRGAATSGGSPVTIARFVYGIDPATSASGLPGMAAAATTAWGQETAPTYGAAVFSQDRAGQVTGSGVGNVTAEQWPYADLQYTDADGRVVNTAAYGAGDWQVTATRYDAGGLVTHEWDQRATAQVRALYSEQGALSADVVDSYATITRYNSDIMAPAAITWNGGTIAAGTVLTPAGTLVTDTWAPARETDHGLVREHTHTDYDQGAPNSGVNPVTGLPYRLATTVAVTEADALTGSAAAEVPVATDELVVSQELSGYDPIDGTSATGTTSGWTLGAATTTTQVMEAGQENIVTRTRYDADGRVLESRKPGSTGTDAATTLTGYYTAAAQTGVFSGCGSRPGWAGLACQTRTGEATQTLPVSTTTYSLYLGARTQTETLGGVTRTTTTDYDLAGRAVLDRTVVSGLTGSTPVDATRTVYSPTSGVVTATVALNSSGAETGRISTGYDLWGRETTYTDTDDAVTTSAYDAAGNLASVTDPQRTVEYEYDTSTEHRGLPTVTRIPGVGQFTATYDATGAMTTQSLLGGRVTQHLAYDRAGELTGLTYTGAPLPGGEEQDLLAWSIESDIQGRTTTLTSLAGTGADGIARTQHYTYDQAERLIDVADTIGETCTTRDYGFDQRGNRLSQATAVHIPDPETGEIACTTTPVDSVNKAWAYDTTDRVRDAATFNGTSGGAYVYDPLGRQTLLPAADTPAGQSAGDIQIGYYDTDAVRALTQDGTTTTYSLDPAGRRGVATTAAGDQSTTLTRHYTDSSDNPGYAVKNTGNVSTSTWYGASIGGDLGLETTTTTTAGDTGQATSTLTLADPIGSVATTIELPAVTEPLQIGAVGTWDEYGNTIATGGTTTGGTTGAISYGWLGAKERAQDSTGLTLMGARLYNKVTGLFTSVDPVEGGNTTAYTYPQDPVNSSDLDGKSAKRWWKKNGKWVLLGAAVLAIAAVCIFATAACGAAVGIGARVATRYVARYAVSAARTTRYYGSVSSRGWAFGNRSLGAPRPGRFNNSPKGSGRSALGWSVKSYGKGKPAYKQFRYKSRSGRHYDIYRGRRL
ncbi:DNRLRE domain-containing protein [Promicromonospora sp. Populi]|uniref:DNRLRE domain-containing protein n=1 Tax=Promicromonospora sp. Populi TaxID=3239420 RepID=UPI0034E19D9A